MPLCVGANGLQNKRVIRDVLDGTNMADIRIFDFSMKRDNRKGSRS
jgi:hypothetical protein